MIPRRPVRALLIVVLVLFGAAQPAYAYVDPGSGGMLVQLLLGGVAGAAVVVKLFWHRFMTLLGFRSNNPGE